MAVASAYLMFIGPVAAPGGTLAWRTLDIAEAEDRGIPAPRFVDVARLRGIDFQHFDPVTEKQYVSETIGSGAGWIDIDADGLLDQLLINANPMPGAPVADPIPRHAIYRNRPEGKFEERSDQVWECPPSFGQGCAVGDYDNDGFDDLYISNYLGPNRLYQNRGDGTLTVVRDEADCPLWSTSCAFGDLDRDGDLDLYVCNYLTMPLDDYPFCGDKRRNIRTVCSPAKFPGQADVVYGNQGDGTFIDVSEAWGFRPESGRSLGVVVADLDGDEWCDVYVANDLSPNAWYRGRGAGQFQESGLLAGCALSADGKAQAGMGVDVGDVDRDGRLDIFVTNFFREPNSLFHNQGDGKFVEVSARAGLGRPSYLKLGFGCGLFDADADGDLDVFVANGHIDRNPEAHGAAEPYRQPAQLFLGDGRGRFSGINDSSAGSYFSEPRVGRAAAFADFDNDGREDIAVNHNGEPAALLHNERDEGARWLRLRLIGTRSNRGGVGSRVTVVIGGESRIMEAMGGRSYLSAHDARLLIGLGLNDLVDCCEIRWPSGMITTLSQLAAGESLGIRESTNAAWRH